jgi:hypothetical protein
MNYIRRFASLDSADRTLFLEAVLLTVAARLSLWMVSFGRALRIVAAIPLPRRRTIPVERAVWAVGAAARIVPSATCLIQAVALRQTLLRSGRSCTLELGVANGARGFEAHAWVELENRPLLSSPDEIERFSRLMTLEGF